MRSTALALFMAAALLPSSALLAQTASTLEERMSAAEFERAGLAKLSPEELAALNGWLQANASAQAPAGEDRRGFAPRPSAASDAPVAARIVGSFDGIEPQELFRLDNGQVWRSIDDSAVWTGVKTESPAATIRRGTFGGWRLTLRDHNGMARVERVE